MAGEFVEHRYIIECRKPEDRRETRYRYKLLNLTSSPEETDNTEPNAFYLFSLNRHEINIYNKFDSLYIYDRFRDFISCDNFFIAVLLYVRPLTV